MYTRKGRCWNSGSVPRQLGISPCTRSSSRLNICHASIYNNVKFAPAALLRHPRRDVTYIAFLCVLMGKVYWRLSRFVTYESKQKPYNFTTNTLKAYLSAQASSLSGFVSARRQLNAKVCGHESAIFLILVTTTMFNNDISQTVEVLTVILARNWSLSQRRALRLIGVFISSNSPWSTKAIHDTLWLLSVVKDAIFECCTHAHM